MSEHHRDIAAQRWRAVEGFNVANGLSPAARRVGICLVTTMDAKTLACFPGESRIAAQLGISERAVRAAKAELKARGMIEWTNHGGPRHVSRYLINWAKMEVWAQDGKYRVREVEAEGKPEADFRVKQEAECRMKPEADFRVESDDDDKPAVSSTKPEADFLSNRKPTSAELSHLSLPAESAQQRGAAAAAPDGASSAPRDCGDVLCRHLTCRMEREEAAERAMRKASKRQRPRFFPPLFEALPDMAPQLERLSYDVQCEASKLLAMQGVQAAADYVRKHAA